MEKNNHIEQNSNYSNYETMASYSIGDNLQIKTADNNNLSCWGYWRDFYYPTYSYSYPVYIKDRAEDKGKQAFEIIKVLKDKRFISLEKVGDFIDLMDELIKIL